MDVTSFNSKRAPISELNRLFNYRYDVFVKHLKWDLYLSKDNHELKFEIDQFDNTHTHYVVAKDTNDNIIGCARLLPTSQDYLLEEVFPELLNGMQAPKSDFIWELSRFTAMDLVSHGLETKPDLISEASIELMSATLRVAKKLGAKKIVSVSPVGVERMLRMAGFKARRMGPPTMVNGFNFVGCVIDL